MKVCMGIIEFCNNFILGAVCRCRHERPLLFAVAFDNGFADRESAFKRLNGNNLATSCTILVNLCLLTTEFTVLKCAIIAATRPQFPDQFSFGTLEIAILISEEKSVIISVHLVEIW